MQLLQTRPNSQRGKTETQIDTSDKLESVKGSELMTQRDVVALLKESVRVTSRETEIPTLMGLDTETFEQIAFGTMLEQIGIVRPEQFVSTDGQTFSPTPGYSVLNRVATAAFEQIYGRNPTEEQVRALWSARSTVPRQSQSGFYVAPQSIFAEFIGKTPSEVSAEIFAHGGHVTDMGFIASLSADTKFAETVRDIVAENDLLILGVENSQVSAPLALLIEKNGTKATWISPTTKISSCVVLFATAPYY